MASELEKASYLSKGSLHATVEWQSWVTDRIFFWILLVLRWPTSQDNYMYVCHELNRFWTKRWEHYDGVQESWGLSGTLNKIWMKTQRQGKHRPNLRILPWSALLKRTTPKMKRKRRNMPHRIIKNVSKNLSSCCRWIAGQCKQCPLQGNLFVNLTDHTDGANKQQELRAPCWKLFNGNAKCIWKQLYQMYCQMENGRILEITEWPQKVECERNCSTFGTK